MEKVCAISGRPFVISEAEQALLGQLKVPLPTLAPLERLRRRLAQRNENCLYRRPCDLCGKGMIALFDRSVPFPVYCSECFWSDKWDPLSYGRDYDGSRPFFEQFRELLMTMPKAGVLHFDSDNCEYNSFSAFARNCYMSAGTYSSEDCIYVRKSQHCTQCLNSNLLNQCELVAYSTNCDACYQASYLVNCRNCSDSRFLRDCTGCRNCLMCSGLEQQQYCFKNQVYAPEQYAEIVRSYAGKSERELEAEFEEFVRSVGLSGAVQLNCEDCEGSYLQNCKGLRDCYDCFDSEDSFHLLACNDVKNCSDLTMHDKEIAFCYELCSGGEKNYLTKFGFCMVDCSECEYGYCCFNLKNCFGCDSVCKRGEFLILNKQYSESEYRELRAKIVEQMKANGEYGEFFPASLSLFGYNETLAQDILPLTREQAVALGYYWRDLKEAVASAPGEALSCSDCGKAFKVIEPEANLEKKIGVQSAKRCFDCRRRKVMRK